MTSLYYLAILTISLSNSVFSAKLPSRYERCQVSQDLDNKPNECLRQAATGAVQELADTGTPELGVNDLDPMQINYIRLQSGKDRPVSITLTFKNNTLSGLGGFALQEFNGKLSSPQGFQATILATTPNMELSGPYKISGKVLILPIQGEGLSNMTLRNITTKIVLNGEPKMKNGKEYLHLTGFKMSLDLERLYMSLQNLFNGNKALGDNMNFFINQNWKDIYNELRPSIEEAFAGVFLEHARTIFEKVPFADIFIVNS